MPHIISTVCPGASGAARNELSLLDLDHVSGGDAASDARRSNIDMINHQQTTIAKAVANADSYIRG